MSSNSIQIVPQLHRDFQELVEFVTNAESQSRTAYEVELTPAIPVLASGLISTSILAILGISET